MNCQDETPRDRSRRLRAEFSDEERKLWQHLASKRERKDGLRMAYLNEQGYRVMRFWNQQVNT